jgi:hypothetical protein
VGGDYVLLVSFCKFSGWADRTFACVAVFPGGALQWRESKNWTRRDLHLNVNLVAARFDAASLAYIGPDCSVLNALS